MYKSTLQGSSENNEYFTAFSKSQVNEQRQSKVKFLKMTQSRDKQENAIKKSTSSSQLMYSPSQMNSHLNSVVLLGDKTNKNCQAFIGQKDNCVACCKKK